MRLTDLFSTIDAICLYDRIATLPCTLTPDVNALLFRQSMISNGVLFTLDMQDHRARIAELIVKSLEQIANSRDQDSRTEVAPPVPFAPDAKRGFENFFQLDSATTGTSDDGVQASRELWGRFSRGDSITNPFDVYVLSGGRSSGALKANSFERLAQSLVWSMDYQGSGAYEDCTSILRDMYYIYTSELLRLPYWPQCDRIDFAKSFPNYMNESIRTQLYKVVADGFHTVVSEVEKDHSAETVFIPPFAALVLSRCNTKHDMAQHVLEVRSEFSGLRRQLGDLERERIEAKTIGERRKLKEKYKALLAHASKAYERPSIASLEAVIRYVPELVKPVTKPLDPRGYTANLLLQPIEWIVAWWRRRPLSKLLQLARTTEEIEHYAGLIKKLFGDEVFLAEGR